LKLAVTLKGAATSTKPACAGYIIDWIRNGFLSNEIVLVRSRHPKGCGYKNQARLRGLYYWLRYKVVKLLDYQDRWSELERSTNPFAVMVMAHLKTIATRQDARKRLEWKTRVVRGLLDVGYNQQEIRNLLRLLYWMMRLPENLEREFQLRLDSFLEEKEMPYVMMPCEQDAMERGLERGILQKSREAVIDILSMRFDLVPDQMADRINELSDTLVLRDLLRRAVTIASLSDFSEEIQATDCWAR